MMKEVLSRLPITGILTGAAIAFGGQVLDHPRSMGNDRSNVLRIEPCKKGSQYSPEQILLREAILPPRINLGEKAVVKIPG